MKKEKNPEDFMNAEEITYLEELSKTPLTKEEEKKWIDKIRRNDQEARNQFIKMNLPLVLKVTEKYKNQGVEWFDLIQEGSIALIEAFDTFDETKGSFESHAILLIQRSIQKVLEKQLPIINFTYQQSEFIKKYKKIAQLLERRWNRKPTSYELALELDICEEEILQLESLLQNKIPTIISLEESNLETKNSSLFSYDNLEESILQKKFQNQVRELLKKIDFTNKQKEIIQYLYGLDTEKKSIKQISKLLGIRTNYILKLNKKILKKMKFQSEIKNLLDYAINPNAALKSISFPDKKRTKKTKEEYFRATEEELAYVDSNLTDLEKNLLDQNFEGSTLTIDQKAQYYGEVVPKIKQLLLKKKGIL